MIYDEELSLKRGGNLKGVHSDWLSRTSVISNSITYMYQSVIWVKSRI
jgi:hypothetical protein